MTAHDPGQLSLDLQAPRRKADTAPTAGVIVGGPYDGWSYVLLEVRRADRRSYPYVRATPPAWPFPREVLVKPPAHLVATDAR